MIIIGKAGCPACVELKEKNPFMQYIEIPNRCTTPEMREIKKKIWKLKFKTFPIVVTDDMEAIIKEGV